MGWYGMGMEGDVWGGMGWNVMYGVVWDGM